MKKKIIKFINNIINKIINLIKKLLIILNLKKKLVLIILVISSTITFSGLHYINYNKKQLLMEITNNVTNSIIDKLNKDTISGNMELVLKMKGYHVKNEVVNGMKYLIDYTVDVDKNLFNIDTKALYKKNTVETNIKNFNNIIYFSSNDLFDGYISYKNDYLDIIKATKDYLNIISIFNKELNTTLKTKDYTYETVSFMDKRVNKISFDMTGRRYKKVKEKIINKLINNKKFIKSLSNIKGLSKKETIKYIKKFEFDDLNISLYTNKYTNKFIAFEIETKEQNLIVTKNEKEYEYKYYINNGLAYHGNFTLSNKKLQKIRIKNAISLWDLEIEVEKSSIKYNKKIPKINVGNYINAIYYKNIGQKHYEEMKKNDMFNLVYENYLNREYKFIKESSEDNLNDDDYDLSKILEIDPDAEVE